MSSNKASKQQKPEKKEAKKKAVRKGSDKNQKPENKVAGKKRKTAPSAAADEDSDLHETTDSFAKKPRKMYRAFIHLKDDENEDEDFGAHPTEERAAAVVLPHFVENLEKMQIISQGDAVELEEVSKAFAQNTSMRQLAAFNAISDAYVGSRGTDYNAFVKPINVYID